jgi:hypothetical protein
MLLSRNVKTLQLCCLPAEMTRAPIHRHLLMANHLQENKHHGLE